MNRTAPSHDHRAIQPHAAAAYLSRPEAHAPCHVRPIRTSVRVLVIPGLRDSGDTHWQTWLQGQYVDAARVSQRDWRHPDLAAWSSRIDDTLARNSRHTQWVAVAHSFGCLALASHLAQQTAHQAATTTAATVNVNGAKGYSDDHPPPPARIVAALMVAPADPVKFALTEALPHHALGLPLTVIGSENDPWMPLDRAREWAHAWGGGFINLGQVGHINTESGFGPWPLARQKVDHLVRQQQRLHSSLCGTACSAP
jgi:predicted alpha/beta hydrolase family esterase